MLAGWLMAEGDKQMRRIYEVWRRKMQSESKKRKESELGDGDMGGYEGDEEGIWTDGASVGNGQNDSLTGWGVFFAEGDSRNMCGRLEGPVQTNQRAELTAGIQTLEYCVSQNRSTFYKIWTDSMYLIDGIVGKAKLWARYAWRKADGKEVANQDLWMKILVLVEKIEGRLGISHVRGHSGDKGNDGADKLAVEGALGRSVGEDKTEGGKESEKMKRIQIVEIKRRNAVEKRIREQKLVLEQEWIKRRKMQIKRDDEKRLKWKQMMQEVDKYEKYRTDVLQARKQGKPIPRMKTIKVHKLCGWPGHAKKTSGVCPLHEKYDGMLPKRHYGKVDITQWLSRQKEMQKEGEDTIQKERQYVCGVCKRKRFSRKTRMKKHEKECMTRRTTRLMCATVGCEYTGIS